MSKKKLGKRLRQTEKKDGFLPRLEAIFGTREKNFLTVDCHGVSKLTFVGFYKENALGIQNKREWDRSSCLRYDNIVWEYLAPAFADQALDDMDEFDFLNKWDKLESTVTSEAKLSDAFTMVRLIAKYAYDIGAISISLEGVLPEEWSGPSRKTQKTDDKQQVKRLVEKGIRIRPSLPLVTELKLHLTLLSMLDLFGQALGGLLIFILGNRTSEVLAFRYKHLVEIEPGTWGLLRLDVLQQGARDSVTAGKTHNAFRWHWIPHFLAKCLLARREQLRTLFPTEDIDEYYIVCFGTDYKRSVTLQEFNAFMKSVYLKIGINQDVLRSAYSEIRENAETLKQYERSLTAYLGRHQALTAMVACGLPEAAICFLAGHAQIDPYMESFDFSNPDEYQKLIKALSRRPVIQVLDQLSEHDEFWISGGKMSFLSDSWAKVVFETKEEKLFLVNAYGREANTAIDVADISNLEILQQVPTVLEKEPDNTHTISIRHRLWQRGQAAFEKIKNNFNAPTTDRVFAMEDSEWLESANDLELVPCIAAPRTGPSSTDAWNILPVHQPSATQNTSKDSEKHTDVTVARDKSTRFYAADTKQHLISIEGNNCTAQKRGTRGKRVLPKEGHASHLYVYRANELAFLLSKEGYLHRILAGTFLGESQYADILRNGGFLLQSPALTSPGSSLVCLTSDGGLISVSVNSLAGSFPAQGLPLMKAELAKGGITVAAACICPANTDVLLVSKLGQALRVKHSKLPAYKSTSLTPIRGIQLASGDAPAACCPFTEQGVLGISTHGKGLLVCGLSSIPAQNLGSKGVAFMKLEPGDSIMDVLDAANPSIAMLREDGYLCCTSLKDFPVRGRNSKGVRAMAAAAGADIHPVVAAISF